MYHRHLFYLVLSGSLIVGGFGLIIQNPFYFTIGCSGFLYAVVARLFLLITAQGFFSRKLQVQRRLSRDRIFTGEDIDIVLEIINGSPFTFTEVEIVEECDTRLKCDKKNWQRTLFPYSSVIIHYHATGLTCGEIFFYGTRLCLHSADGLFSVERFFPLSNRMTIYPYLESIRLKKYPVDRGSMLIGKYRKQVKGVGSEFSDLRYYLPGDPLRSIEWKASVRTGELMVREWESEESLRVSILLDASVSMYEGTPPKRKIDYAIAVITNLVENLLKERDLVAIAAFRNQRGDYPRIRYGHGRLHMYRILNFLVDMAQVPMSDMRKNSYRLIYQVGEYLKMVDPMICKEKYIKYEQFIPVIGRFLGQYTDKATVGQFLKDPLSHIDLLLDHCQDSLALLLRSPRYEVVDKPAILSDLFKEILKDTKEEGLILIFSDFEGIDSEGQFARFIKRCKLAQAYHQTIFILAPFAPEFVSAEALHGVSERMKDIVNASYYSSAAYLRQEFLLKMQSNGINVLSLFASESLGTLTRRLEQIKSRNGTRR